MKQFTFTSVLIAVASVAFWLGASNHRTVRASGLTGTQGRFQIVQTTVTFTGDGVEGHAPMPFMVDTVTGRAWQYEGPMTDAKHNLIFPGGWNQVDYTATTIGADGKERTIKSALPPTTVRLGEYH